MVASSEEEEEGKDVLLGHKMSKLCDKLQTFSPLPPFSDAVVRAAAAAANVLAFWSEKSCNFDSLVFSI